MHVVTSDEPHFHANIHHLWLLTRPNLAAQLPSDQRWVTWAAPAPWVCMSTLAQSRRQT